MCPHPGSRLNTLLVAAVRPHTSKLDTVLLGVSIVLCPHTSKLDTVLVSVSIVFCVCGQDMAVNCVECPHTGELDTVLVGVSIVSCVHKPAADWIRFL